jgi:hypothetical protein
MWLGWKGGRHVVYVIVRLAKFNSVWRNGLMFFLRKRMILTSDAGSLLVIMTLFAHITAILTPEEAGAWVHLPQRGSFAYLRDRHYSHDTAIKYQLDIFVAVTARRGDSELRCL